MVKSLSTLKNKIWSQSKALRSSMKKLEEKGMRENEQVIPSLESRDIEMVVAVSNESQASRLIIVIAIFIPMKKIENQGKHLRSVVYGSLPLETRTRQASMFNDATSEFDVLVASDAIGMGLNLNISRIIFSTLKKFDGRAGRYESNFPVGEVTCVHAEGSTLASFIFKLPTTHFKGNLTSITLYENHVKGENELN
ncbi:hypothetical protein Ahy_A06g027107 [Arachis hypogaea]|uniref:Helicase C-terminal domain-containing protein n=1 Tax=Arachis hypogaea TaxID=3818 RepID=A0A445CMP1_ARAHY|nr:hypothetical protein Ahy_A06g027107 [Arachis hypogaea]